MNIQEIIEERTKLDIVLIQSYNQDERAIYLVAITPYKSAYTHKIDLKYDIKFQVENFCDQINQAERYGRQLHSLEQAQKAMQQAGQAWQNAAKMYQDSRK